MKPGLFETTYSARRASVTPVYPDTFNYSTEDLEASHDRVPSSKLELNEIILKASGNSNGVAECPYPDLLTSYEPSTSTTDSNALLRATENQKVHKYWQRSSTAIDAIGGSETQRDVTDAWKEFRALTTLGLTDPKWLVTVPDSVLA